MAFPVEETTSSGTNVSQTSHTITLPTGIAAGNRVVVAFGFKTAATVTWPGGWTLIVEDQAFSSKISVYELIASGGETSITVTTSGAAQNSMYLARRISGAHASAASEGGTGSGRDTDDSAAPNPPNLTPSWGSDDTLWLAFHVCFENQTTPTYPTNYIGGFYHNMSAGPSMGTARRALAAASENPGVFALSDWTPYNAATVAIRPVAAAGAAALDAGEWFARSRLPEPVVTVHA